MRGWLYLLLGAVALAAAVLSFAALRDLALLCGFSTRLAPLLPVVVDAGAAAGTLVWLGGREPDHALRFARRLALTLLCGSIFANGLSHGVAAYRDRAPWWVVIVACVVSGAAPAVLGAVVHLVALRGRVGDSTRPEPQRVAIPGLPVGDSPAPPPAGDAAGEPVDELIASGAGWRKVQAATGLTPHYAKKLIAERRNGSTP